jgi:hypothetical protein
MPEERDVPPLTQEQIFWAAGVFNQWLSIRSQAKMTPSTQNGASFTKSCLLGRMLSGGTVLPDPPPTAHSAPWYELIESGDSGPLWSGACSRRGLLADDNGREATFWNIQGCIDWVELWVHESENHIILDRYHRWDPGKVMGERWLLSHLATLDPIGERQWRLRRIDQDLALLLTDMGAPDDAVFARPDGGMTGCRHCGVGPEDDCTMDCISRTIDFDVLADLDNEDRS